MPKVARLAWAVLAYNVAVILWGASVQGDGLGCGMWGPLAAVQRRGRAARGGVATLIEFSHRATSGLALLAVAALVVATFRTCRARASRARRRGHVRRADSQRGGGRRRAGAVPAGGRQRDDGPGDVRGGAPAEHVPAARRADADRLVAVGRRAVHGRAPRPGLPDDRVRGAAGGRRQRCGGSSRRHVVSGAVSGRVASRRSLVHVAPPDPAPRLPPGARGRGRRCRRRLCCPPRTIRADAEPARRSHRHGHRPGPRSPSASSTSSCSRRCGCSSRTCSSRMRCGSASCCSVLTP